MCCIEQTVRVARVSYIRLYGLYLFVTGIYPLLTTLGGSLFFVVVHLNGDELSAKKLQSEKKPLQLLYPLSSRSWCSQRASWAKRLHHTYRDANNHISEDRGVISPILGSLILVVGVVEQNPGPKCTCKVCRKALLTYSVAFQCILCQQWLSFFEQTLALAN